MISLSPTQAQMRGGAVDRNDARTALGGDGVGGEALAVIHVVNIDRFIFQNAGGLQEILVDGAGPFIVQVSLSDFDAMQLALQHSTYHSFT